MSYPPVAKPAAHNAFEIAVIDSFTTSPLPPLTERLKFYELIWIRGGTCTMDINLQTFQIPANTICVLAPGQIRRLQFSSNAHVVYLRSPADFFYQLCSEIRFPAITKNFHHLGRPLQIEIDNTANNNMGEIFEKMHREFNSGHTSRNELLSGWLKIFLIYLGRSISTIDTGAPPNRDTELARRFMELVSHEYTTKKMVAQYADKLMITPNCLNQIVKRVSGFPASHHIQQYLIMEAKRQATQSTRSMKEIAYDLGFDDLAHFSKFFKSKSGTNFSNFKKRQAGFVNG